ncbi:unnamed protein product [Acanthoscelides obtectus]|uniref:Uncharacterized protein n=1 Tax=Acanthoscelides obtectus TaxID=200917 RepID=A0A9P0QAG9_ACAOB|nr:unnamed protein product [Acanthoscelides obtectus]CAK1638901.1 hypothetical protein AOBTE_LOCUS10876 [Acanthoscelides obtectus]
MCEEEDVLFKSCFARSLAVNSQYKQQTTKSSAADNQQVQNQRQPKISDHLGTSVKSSCAMNGQHPCIPEMSTSASQQVMLRKVS